MMSAMSWPLRVFIGVLLLSTAASAAAGEWDGLYKEEAPRIAAAGERVHRKGDVLHLRLESGEDATFANPAKSCEDEDEDCIVYVFDSYFEAGRSFVVEALYIEADEFLLVDGRSGEQTAVVARPRADPDGHRFICVRRDEMMGYAMEMWRLTGSTPTQEWSYAPDRPLDFVAWRSADDVELAAVTYTGDGETTKPAHLLHDAEGWRLVGDGFDQRIPAQ